MSQTVPQTRKFTDAAGLIDGVNSYVDPQFVKDTQVRWAENAVNKGGLWQTRPGFDPVVNLYLDSSSGDYYTYTVKPNTSFTGNYIEDNNHTFVLNNQCIYKVGDTIIASRTGEPNDWFQGNISEINGNTIRVATSSYNNTGYCDSWEMRLLTPSINPQFFTVFTPSGGSPQFVFAVSGYVFYCTIRPDNTIETPKVITQITFDPNATQVIGVSTVKTADLQNGTVFVVSPQNVLILQDGVNRAAYWTGAAGGHLNPEKKWTTDTLGNTIYVDGYNQTRSGLFMAWSGNRLWVANGSQVFASDLGDPLHFTEETVLVNIPSFTFPNAITGMVDRGTSGIQNNLVFITTKYGVFGLCSGIQNRSNWINTADFQRKIFSGVGGLSHKAMINHMGLLHWYSDAGIVAFDSLGTVVSTQALPPIDSELAYSKAQMGSDRSRICAGSFDSYVWWSVPVARNPTSFEFTNNFQGRMYNGHTQVLDRIVTPIEFNISAGSSFGNSAWQGVWTGLRPVEWATNEIWGKNRTFCLSIDYDSVLRIWEGFNGNRSDNNGPITWAIETKAHSVTESVFARSVFRHFRVLLTQIYGGLSIKGYWKGLRGHYHQLMDTSVMATPGSVLLDNPEYTPIYENTPNVGFAKQTRDILSQDNRATEECTAAGVESQDQDDIDRAFSLQFVFSGIGALKAYRLATDYNPDNTEGAVVEPEIGQKILPEVGCPVAVPSGSQEYTLVKRPNRDALVPVTSSYIETGYTPNYLGG